MRTDRGAADPVARVGTADNNTISTPESAYSVGRTQVIVGVTSCPTRAANERISMTVEAIRRWRRPLHTRCVITGCPCAGTIGLSICGNRDWLCWQHYLEVEGAE